MFFIGESPADGSSGSIIVADETHELASQIVDGVKYAARDDLALNFREPVFNLVEPGGIGWGIVDAEVGISCEKCRNLFGFMGAQVIGDDVDLAAWGLTGEDLVEELDKLGAGMPRLVLPSTSPVRVSRAA